MEEVERQIREAIEFHIRGMREDGSPIPELASCVEVCRSGRLKSVLAPVEFSPCHPPQHKIKPFPYTIPLAHFTRSKIESALSNAIFLNPKSQLQNKEIPL